MHDPDTHSKREERSKDAASESVDEFQTISSPSPIKAEGNLQVGDTANSNPDRSIREAMQIHRIRLQTEEWQGRARLVS